MKHLLFLAFFAAILPFGALAQDTPRPESFTANATAQDAGSILTPRYQVRLWGVEAVRVSGTTLSLSGRTAMDDLLQSGPINCAVVQWVEEQPVARCLTGNNTDLAAAMLQKGFVVVQRQAVAGTAFEELYLSAEKTARSQKLGAWKDDGRSPAPAADPGSLSPEQMVKNIAMLILGSALFTLMVISILIMRGFAKVERMLQKTLALSRSQEERMRSREKSVLATMLTGELASNKGKIEAFLVINRDLLQSLRNAKDKGAVHKFQTSSEIVQQRPSLLRSVFDGNTDKLELLGSHNVKDFVALYETVSAESGYITLDRNITIEEAIGKVQRIVVDAESLIEPIDALINAMHIILRDRKQRKSTAPDTEDTFSVE